MLRLRGALLLLLCAAIALGYLAASRQRTDALAAATEQLQHADHGAPDACALQHALSGLRPQRVRFVLHEQPHFPQNPFSLAAPTKAFISQCLQREPAQRPDAASVWSHPFIARPLPPKNADAGLKRDAVLHKRVTPPFVPRLRHPLDTSYCTRGATDSDSELSEAAAAADTSDDDAAALHLPDEARMRCRFRAGPCETVDELLSDR